MSTLASDARVIEGTFFDGRSARGLPARLLASLDGGCQLQLPDGQHSVDLATATFSARIGNIARHVHFATGGYFETFDNPAIDAVLVWQRQRPGWVQGLERQWHAALVSLLLLIAVAVLTYTVGVPWLAQRVAATLPDSVDARLGQGVMQVLDGRLLAPSTLSAQRQEEVQQQFFAVIATQDDNGSWQLQLRDAPTVGANAFALPGGTLVITDQLVNLVQHDEELLAVIAHEVGHVRRRHALRQVLQGLGVSALAMAVFGDISALSSFTVAVPTLLQAGYSRDMEREADADARRWLLEHGIAAHRFDDLMCRLAAAHGAQPDSKYNYFASHPAVSQRAHCGQ